MSRPRVRWLTLAELVAVAGVAIAGLGLWNGMADRRAAQADRVAGRAAESAARGRMDLRGTATKDGDAVTLAGEDGRELTDVRVAFPAALGVPAHDAPDNRIARDWFSRPLLDATNGTATGLLPVLVTYGWTDTDGDPHRGSGVYDLVWRSHGRVFPLGRALDVTGFRLRAKGGDQARLDAAWAREKPAKS